MRLPSFCVRSLALSAFGVWALAALALNATAQAAVQSFGIVSRVLPRAYLNMPRLATGDMPPLLSQTGVFSSTAQLKPAAGLIPYDLIVAFWSDGARKSRMVAVPRGAIAFSAAGEWKFPDGTVFVKTFVLPTDATQPTLQRRLETRLLVRHQRRWSVWRNLQMACG